jgi:hypothetical protein
MCQNSRGSRHGWLVLVPYYEYPEIWSSLYIFEALQIGLLVNQPSFFASGSFDEHMRIF